MNRIEKRKMAGMLLVVMSAPVLILGTLAGVVICHGWLGLWETLPFIPVRDQWLLGTCLAASVIGFAIYPYHKKAFDAPTVPSGSVNDGVWPPAPTDPIPPVDPQ
jgi:hypothetical protein